MCLGDSSTQIDTSAGKLNKRVKHFPTVRQSNNQLVGLHSSQFIIVSATCKGQYCLL